MPTPVDARTVCGTKVHKKYGETRARFKSTLATVRQDGSAHAVIYRSDKTAPLGWSHVLRIWRPHHNGNWKLQLTAVQPMADTNHPFWLSIGNAPPITFEIPHIQTPQSLNEYELSSETNQLGQTIDEIRAGRALEWRYVAEDGRDATAQFPLSGLTAATRWLECAAGGE